MKTAKCETLYGRLGHTRASGARARSSRRKLLDFLLETAFT